MKVGFIGLGAMGAPMARHLHAKGLLTAVGNRTQSKADELAAELGVRLGRGRPGEAGHRAQGEGPEEGRHGGSLAGLGDRAARPVGEAKARGRRNR